MIINKEAINILTAFYIFLTEYVESSKIRNSLMEVSTYSLSIRKNPEDTCLCIL